MGLSLFLTIINGTLNTTMYYILLVNIIYSSQLVTTEWDYPYF